MTTVFKALSDDTRRQILKLLANGDMTAKEISENFTISKPAISKHLDKRTNGDVRYLFP